MPSEQLAGARVPEGHPPYLKTVVDRILEMSNRATEVKGLAERIEKQVLPPKPVIGGGEEIPKVDVVQESFYSQANMTLDDIRQNLNDTVNTLKRIAEETIV